MSSLVIWLACIVLIALAVYAGWQLHTRFGWARPKSLPARVGDVLVFCAVIAACGAALSHFRVPGHAALAVYMAGAIWAEVLCQVLFGRRARQ